MSSDKIQSQGRLKKFLSTEKFVRASVVELTDLLEEVRLMQGTSPTSTVALGRLLTGTLLIASQMKDDQAIAFHVSGNKDLKKIFAHAQYDGLCRGFVSSRQAPMSVKNNQFSLAQVIGGGLLTASIFVPGTKVPHQSQLHIVSGEIGEDLAHYLNQSQQIPCLLSLAVKLGSEGKVVAAGGVLVELMPGHTEETLKEIEFKQKTVLPLSELIEDDYPMSKLLENYVGPIEMHEIKENPVSWFCTCSKDKASASIKMLGASDMKDMIEKKEKVTVDCEMCGRIYGFETTEIEELYKDSGGKGSLH